MSTQAREPDLPSVADVIELAGGLREPLLELVRALDDLRVPVRRLQWNAGELGAHMVSILETYVAILRGQGSPFRSVDVAEVTRANAAGVATVADRSGPALAQADRRRARRPGHRAHPPRPAGTGAAGTTPIPSLRR